ncbi:MAG: hypothetical protein Q9178_002217 [Gyalolechia marmorata]
MFSRRKPATYGKSMRKPLSHCFEPSALDPSRPGSNGLASQSDVAASGAQGAGNQISPHRHDRPPQKADLSLSSELPGDYTAPAGVPCSLDVAGHGRSNKTLKRHDTWDLPSSDEAERNVRPNATSLKKRRRIATPAPGVMGDGNQGRRNARNTRSSTSKTTGSSTSNDLVDGTRSLKLDSTPSPAPLYVSHRSLHVSPLSSRATHGPRSPPKGAEHTRRSSHPTPRTPTPEKCVVKDTAPHQQELWSMLLPGHYELGPGDRSHGSPNTSPSKSARPSTPEARPRTKGKPRGRLIDKLLPAVQAPPSYTTKSSGLALISDSEEEEVLDFKNGSPGNGENRALISHIKPKATYSSQRSFLVAEELDEPSFDEPLVDDDQKSKKRLRIDTMSLDIGFPEGVQEDDFEDSQGSSMRTIHELRESGENVRHLNDTEAFFDDIDGQSLASMSLKRRRLLDLIRRLQEPAFCRLVLDQGFDNRLLTQSASRDNDAIADALLAVAVLYLIAAPSGRQAFSKSYDLRIADFFATKLDRDQDLIKLVRNRKSNLSKQDQSDFKGYFVEGLLRSSVWRGGAPTKLSMRLIALQGLEYLVRTRREAGCKAEILPSDIIQRLVQGLPSAHRTVDSSVDLLLEIRMAVSILESYTISGASHDDQQWTGAMLGPITAVLPWLTCNPNTGGDDTQKLTLRLYLNLTNNNPRLCEAFAGDELLRAILSVIESHFRLLSGRKQELSGSDVLDTLILALGTLINLVEWSSTVRDLMTTADDQDECMLGTLVKLFVARQKAVAEVYSEEETSSNVAFGYLSVLLSYLCVDKHGRQRVASHLQDGTLRSLLDNVVEFLHYHRQIDDEMDEEDGEMSLKASFISRLDRTVHELRQMG